METTYTTTDGIAFRLVALKNGKTVRYFYEAKGGKSFCGAELAGKNRGKVRYFKVADLA